MGSLHSLSAQKKGKVTLGATNALTVCAGSTTRAAVDFSSDFSPLPNAECSTQAIR